MATDKYDPADPAYVGDLIEDGVIEDDDPVLGHEIQLASDVDVPLAGYDIARTKLRGKSVREDWLVASPPPSSAVEHGDFVARLRWFFAEMEREVDRYRHDPIATASALARVEALLTDVRYVRDRLKSTTAESMDRERVRKLTVSGVVQVEASSEIKRSNWQHAKLLTLILDALCCQFVGRATGEVIGPDVVASMVLDFLTPEWRLTALRQIAGIEPNDYCDIDRDEQGAIVKTPTVQIKDNRVKGQR